MLYPVGLELDWQQVLAELTGDGCCLAASNSAAEISCVGADQLLLDAAWSGQVWQQVLMSWSESFARLE